MFGWCSEPTKDNDEKALDCKDAIDELNESLAECYKLAFDNIVTQYDGILAVVEHERSMLDEYIAQSEEKGHITSTKYYDALINTEKSNIEQLKKEKEALLFALQEAVNSGTIEIGSEAWQEMRNQVDEVTLSIEQANTSILEYNNSIREIEWQIFDLLQGKLTNIIEESDFLIDLLSNDKLYNDNGQLTNEGISTMGLHGMNYNVYMEQADKYAQEMLNINKQLADDPYNQTLIERRQELLELQQESILAAKDEKQAIVDMVEEGIELELGALQELIDSYTEALDSQKDLYDYQKKIAEQTEKIASLEKQMSAYAGDDSEETRTKIQQIKVSLEEARESLEETEYERYISDQKQLLDELYTEYELILNQRLDNIDALITDMINEINMNATTISETITTKADSVGYTLSETMTKTWSTAVGDINSVLITYGQGIQGGITSLQSALVTINSNLQNMISQLDVVAGTNTASASVSSVSDSSNNSYATYTPTVVEDKTPQNTTTDNSKFDNSIFDYKKDTYPKSKLDTKNSITDRLKYNNFDSSFSARSKYYTKMGFTGIYTGSSAQNTKMVAWMQKHGYKQGVYSLSEDELAWTQEGRKIEAIIRPSDGAILTPLAKNDSVLKASATSNIFNFANDPSGFIRNNLNITSSVSNVPRQDTFGGTYDNDFNIQIELPNVTNYEEFKYAMQHDKSFENMVRAMTVDRMFGGSSLKKYRC